MDTPLSDDDTKMPDEQPAEEDTGMGSAGPGEMGGAPSAAGMGAGLGDQGANPMDMPEGEEDQKQPPPEEAPNQ